jgi:hypothetical protein
MLAAWLAVSLPAGRAPAATGVRVLDEAAIAVKAPSKVELIAITRAGNRLVAVGEHGVIIYSDDNGFRWTQASVPVDLLLTAVRFATASVGWAVGQHGVILRTDDGGATWRLQFDGIQANHLTLATAQAATASHDPSPGTPLALRRGWAKYSVPVGSGGRSGPCLRLWRLPDGDENHRWRQDMAGLEPAYR